MIRPFRALGARDEWSSRRWRRIIGVSAVAIVLTSLGWMRHQRLRAVSALQSRFAMSVEHTEGVFWPTRLLDVRFALSPVSSVRVARVELGTFPWQTENRGYGVVLGVHAPLDTVWEEARRFVASTGWELTDARVEQTDASSARLSADGTSFEPSADQGHWHVRSLHAFGTTFRDVHFWASRPSAALQARLAREADDSKAPWLNIVRSAEEGVEWSVGVPSQPFSEWTKRIGLSIDQTWSDAVVVSIGSVIVPDSASQRARATFRFTVDNWHRPGWPDAELLTGRSGAVALGMALGPGTTHSISRVEVTAGLFSLVGSGELSFGEPNRLTFAARGELGCSQLLAHLPDSGYRDRIRAYLGAQRPGVGDEPRVRLELTVRAEAPRARPLEFRWHLHAGCGISEMKEH